ncbi:hypothetical protein EDB84DRAFT_1272826 [Lactarius hengduanensis]|nr:hypothetical protein EDB84DRAFT_1272826 [Lactarius hengduanensis]
MSDRSDAEFHARTAIVEAIILLTKNLPSSVPEGKRDGKLHRVMTNNSYRGETPWETFNKRMDATFGLDIVTKYLLIAIDQPGAKMFHAPMMLKLERLRDELEIVM